VECKKESKLVNVRKKKQIHRYKEPARSRQWGDGSGRGKIGGGV